MTRMSLEANVDALQRETETLEQRCALREREVRAPAVAAEAELSAVERSLAEEQARLAQFTAELRETTGGKPALTFGRSLLAAGALGAFAWGAISSGADVTRLSVGLFVATWVAFLAGALRGR